MWFNFMHITFCITLFCLLLTVDVFVYIITETEKDNMICSQCSALVMVSAYIVVRSTSLWR